MSIKSAKFFKAIAFALCLLLAFQQSGLTQVATQLDIAGHLSALHNSFIPDTFRPLHLRYLSYNPQENNFQLFLDKGSLKNPNPQELEDTTKILLNYFFIGITLPNDTFWVNLRPDSPDNIIDDYLAQTDVGKIMLEADLQLKKDTAKATSPETPEGKLYWDKLYKKAEELFGSENISIPTLTRPWIVPGEIIIRETLDSAYIYKATLKVMLEEDHLRGTKDEGRWTIIDYSFSDPRLKALNEYSSQLIRELIIPKLTKEVNSSKRYANLRQVYYSLIMAQWFKARFNKGLSSQGTVPELIDSRDLTNLTSKDNWSKTTYFQAYQKSFKDGEYNIQQPTYTLYGQSIRSYFSGGMRFYISMQPFGAANGGSSPVSAVVASSSPTARDNEIPLVVPGIPQLQWEAFKKDVLTAKRSSPVGEKAPVIRNASSPAEGSLNPAERIKQIAANIPQQGLLLVHGRVPEHVARSHYGVSVGHQDLATINMPFFYQGHGHLRGSFVFLKNFQRYVPESESGRDILLITYAEEEVGKFEPYTHSETRTMPSKRLFGLLGKLGLTKKEIYTETKQRRVRTGPSRVATIEEFAKSNDYDELLSRLDARTRTQPALIIQYLGYTTGTPAYYWIYIVLPEDDGGKELANLLSERPELIVPLITHFYPLFEQIRLEPSQNRFSQQLMDVYSQTPEQAIQLFNPPSDPRSPLYVYYTLKNFLILRDNYIPYHSPEVRQEIIQTLFNKNSIPMSPEALQARSPSASSPAQNSSSKSIEAFRNFLDQVEGEISNNTDARAVVYKIRQRLDAISDEREALWVITQLNTDSIMNYIYSPPEGRGTLEWLRPIASRLEDLWQSIEEKSRIFQSAPFFENTGIRIIADNQLLTPELLRQLQFLFERTQINSADCYRYFMDHVWVIEIKNRSDLLAWTYAGRFVGFPYEKLSLMHDDVRIHDRLLDAFEHEMAHIKFREDYPISALIAEKTYTVPVEIEHPFVSFGTMDFAQWMGDHSPYKFLLETDGYLVSARCLLGIVQQIYTEDEQLAQERVENLRDDIRRITGGIKGMLFSLKQMPATVFTEQGAGFIRRFEAELEECERRTSEFFPEPKKMSGFLPSLRQRLQELLRNPAQKPRDPSKSSSPAEQPGGIDFRSLPIVTQAIGNLSANINTQAISRLNSLNLEQELQHIQRIINSGITPSAERIKEYVQVSCLKGNPNKDIEKVVSCIADILRLEEERCAQTDATLRDILVVLESMTNMQELRQVFLGKTI